MGIGPKTEQRIRDLVDEHNEAYKYRRNLCYEKRADGSKPCLYRKGKKACAFGRLLPEDVALEVESQFGGTGVDDLPDRYISMAAKARGLTALSGDERIDLFGELQAHHDGQAAGMGRVEPLDAEKVLREVRGAA